MAKDLAEVLHKLGGDQAELEQKIKRAVSDIEGWRRDLERIRTARAVLEEMGVDVEAVPTPQAEKRNDEWIDDIVNTATIEGITDDEVVARLYAEGWTTTATDPRGLVRSYLSRSVKADRVAKVGPQRYAPKGLVMSGPAVDIAHRARQSLGNLLDLDGSNEVTQAS